MYWGIVLFSPVNRRIGGLEKAKGFTTSVTFVNRRIGGLEKSGAIYC